MSPRAAYAPVTSLRTKMATTEVAQAAVSAQSSDSADKSYNGKAANQVFETAELLEMILLQLPTLDIFITQRVSKTFLNTIEGSLKLKRTMFLEAEPETERDEIKEQSEKAENNKVNGIDGDSVSAPSIKINPLLRYYRFIPSMAIEKGLDDYLWVENLGDSIDRPQVFPGSEKPATGRDRPLKHSSIASWRKMLPSQPPPNKFCTAITTHPRPLAGDNNGVISEVFWKWHWKGARMGDFFDHLDESFRDFDKYKTKADEDKA